MPHQQELEELLIFFSPLNPAHSLISILLQVICVDGESWCHYSYFSNLVLILLIFPI